MRLSRLGCFVRELPVMTGRVFSVGLSRESQLSQVTMSRTLVMMVRMATVSVWTKV